MDLYLWSNPNLNNGESVPVKYSFNKGVTMLIGSNGDGKSSALSQIKSLFSESGSWENIPKNDSIRNDYIPYLYDNVHEEKNAKSSWGFYGDYQKIAQTFENSEGQDIFDFLYYKIGELGMTSRKAIRNNKKGVFFLFDGLDSGLSVDMLEKVKHEILDFIVENEKELDVYIICSANSYEFCSGYDCVDVKDGKSVSFDNYESFFNYFCK